MKRNYDSLTRLTANKTSGRNGEKMYSGHKQSLFSSPWICEDDLIALNSVTAMTEPCALDLSFSNLLVIANQNAPAFGLSSILAKQKMRMK